MEAGGTEAESIAEARYQKSVACPPPRVPIGVDHLIREKKNRSIHRPGGGMMPPILVAHWWQRLSQRAKAHLTNTLQSLLPSPINIEMQAENSNLPKTSKRHNKSYCIEFLKSIDN